MKNRAETTNSIDLAKKTDARLGCVLVGILSDYSRSTYHRESGTNKKLDGLVLAVCLLQGLGRHQ